MSVYLLSTLDTKGRETAFVRDILRNLKIDVTVVDTGCLGTTQTSADVTRDQVFAAAGTSLEEMQSQGDRGVAVNKAAEGAARLALEWSNSGEIDGIISLGGSAGTTIGTAAMRVLPLGLPKVMVSTLASGQVRPFVGSKDIMMVNSVVDIAGLNAISRPILKQAAKAMAGMVRFDADRATETMEFRRLVAMSMFGVTTECVMKARDIMDEQGYEVLVFHATGTGGEAMEDLIEQNALIVGVIDFTTTEIADEIVGGTLSAGRNRLTAAGRRGIPQVISVGATDMVNFGPRDTVPERFRGRTFHEHNENVTLMRTTIEENTAIGTDIGKKAAASTGPVSILLPLQGVSAIDGADQPFDDPSARTALFDAVKAYCGEVDVVECDLHINDSRFAELACRKLLEMLTS